MDRNSFNSTNTRRSQTQQPDIPMNDYANTQRYINNTLSIYHDLIHNMSGYTNIMNSYNQNISVFLSTINNYRNDIRTLRSQLFMNLPHSPNNILHTPVNSTRSSINNTPTQTSNVQTTSTHPVRRQFGNTDSYTFSSPNSLFSNIFSFPSTTNVPINQNNMRELLLGTTIYEDVIVSPTQSEIDNAVEVFTYTENNTENQHTCPITMEEFIINDRVSRIRHCGHTFREEAINNWFRMNVRCPVCRYDIREYRNNNAMDISVNNTTDVPNNDDTIDMSSNNIDVSNSTINTDDITNRITNELTSLLTQAWQSRLQTNMNGNSQNPVFSIDIPISITSSYENEYNEDDDDNI